MKTMFGFFSCALTGATAQSIVAAVNSGQKAVLNLRFKILYPFIRDSPDNGERPATFALSRPLCRPWSACVSRGEDFFHEQVHRRTVCSWNRSPGSWRSRTWSASRCLLGRAPRTRQALDADLDRRRLAEVSPSRRRDRDARPEWHISK